MQKDLTREQWLNSATELLRAYSLILEQCRQSEFLGEYPHGELTANGKKQGTRMKKISCNSCDFAFRASQKQIDEIDFGKGCIAIGCEGHLSVEA